jgi:hypothetical protein
MRVVVAGCPQKNNHINFELFNDVVQLKVLLLDGNGEGSGEPCELVL